MLNPVRLTMLLTCLDRIKILILTKKLIAAKKLKPIAAMIKLKTKDIEIIETIKFINLFKCIGDLISKFQQNYIQVVADKIIIAIYTMHLDDNREKCINELVGLRQDLLNEYKDTNNPYISNVINAIDSLSCIQNLDIPTILIKQPSTSSICKTM